MRQSLAKKRLARWMTLAVFFGSITVHAEGPFGGEAPANNPPTTQVMPEDDDFIGDPAAGPPPGFPDSYQPPTNPGTINAPPFVGDNAPNGNEPSSPAPPPFKQDAARRGPEPTLGKSVLPEKKVAKKGGPPVPKLADYLELDPAIRGLEVKNFDLPDKDLKDVVTLISKWTGKNFIIDNKVRGKITIIAPSAVTLQEAYNAFLSALEANSLTTVQSGKFIRIIESSEARRAPVKTYSGDYAPTDDSFITRIFQLKYINADEVQREFRDLTTRQGKLFAYEPTNSIIITDTGSNIQRIKDILEVLDVKSFETTLHVLRIKNSSAKTIAEMLGEIYGDDKKGGSNSRSFRRSALERTRGGGIISRIIPDEQTNSLIVLANESGFSTLIKLVEKLDIKSSDSGRIHVYYCEYAKAEDLANTLAALASGSGGQRGSSRRTTSSSTPGGTSGSGSSNASPVSSGPVTAELDGGVKITSDPSTNSLVITANQSDYKTIKNVLKKLDIPRLQVFVETAILEVAADQSDKRGMNVGAGVSTLGFAGGFLGDQSSLLSYVTGGQATSGSLPEGLSLPAFLGNQFTTQIAGQNVTLSSFMGFLNLFTKTTDASILSTPQIIALDNEKAEFKVKDEIPVVSGSITTQGGAPVTQNQIGKIETGIEIKLTPHINASSKSIRLDIEQTVDTLKTDADVPDAVKQQSRAKTSRVSNTAVVVKDQNYVMLGGLVTDSVDEAVTKVPLLGDIPIVGWLFKSKIYSKKKKNLILLLKPTIINSSTSSAQLIQDKLDQRKDMIGKAGRDEYHSEKVKGLRKELDNQIERGKSEKVYDYQNNDEEEEARKSAEVTTPKASEETKREETP